MTTTDLDVLYDSDHTSVARRILVSVGAGLAFWAMTVFFHWGLHPGADVRAVWIPRILGGAVTLVMLVGAVTSRVVRRVAIDPATRTLHIHRDPAAVENHPLTDIVSATSEASVGGWSTNPSERLVLTLRDGTVRRYTLPDDADTPGIVRDLTAARDGAPSLPAT